MNIRQTPLQKKAVDAIMNHMMYYLDRRFQQVVRINPGSEAAWEDICWQECTKLRRSLSLDKPYGPVRLHMAELLLSDDQKKIYDLLQPKGQYSLLGEIVEERESAGHKTEGQLEIHDMRTLFRAINPNVETLITLMQTYIWWDLPDAILVARFGWKSDRVRNFEEKGITEEMAAYYSALMGEERTPTADDVIAYECRMLDRTLAEFRLRRSEERGFRVIVRREPTPQEDPERLIEALAGQLGLQKMLQKGEGLDDNLREQFAKVMKSEPQDVTAERALPILTEMIGANRQRLKNALTGRGSGELYNLKLRQLRDLEKRFEEITHGKDYAAKGQVPVAPES
jgi:hypothetical protein